MQPRFCIYCGNGETYVEPRWKYNARKLRSRVDSKMARENPQENSYTVYFKDGSKDVLSGINYMDAIKELDASTIQAFTIFEQKDMVYIDGTWVHQK